MKHVKLLFAIVLASALVVACGGGGGDDNNPVVSPLTQFMNRVIAAVGSMSNREPDDISGIAVITTETAEPADIATVPVGT